MPGFETGSVLGTILAVIFYGAAIYAVMRTFWAIWEIPDKLHDIERRLGVLSDDLHKIEARMEAGETIAKERNEQ